MLKLVCLALINIEVEWQYDPKEMKLKCRTKVDDEKLIDDDKFIEDFIRQHFLKFFVYIDKVIKNGPNVQQATGRRRGPAPVQNQDGSGKTISSNGNTKDMKGEVYILNMYLQKGTFPVFLEIADKFFSLITRQLEFQIKSKSENEVSISQTQAETNDGQKERQKPSSVGVLDCK